MNHGTSDQELLALSQNGDDKARERAFAALYARHVRLVVGLSRRFCRNAANVDDVVQETFAAAFKHAASFRGECAFPTWLSRIAIRSAIKIATRATEFDLLGDRDYEGLAQGESHQFGHQSGQSATERQVLAQQLLARLTTEQRLLLVLTSVQGLSQDEIAEMLNIPVGTVWSRLHAARKAAAGSVT